MPEADAAEKPWPPKHTRMKRVSAHTLRSRDAVRRDSSTKK
jgi:hypothetical protein